MPSESYEKFRQLLQRGAFAEAAAFAERASMSGGDRSEFWLTQQAVALTRLGQHEKAVSVAEQAMRVAPHNVYALLAKADACLGAGCVKEALACYEESLNYDAGIARARKGVLNCLIRLEDGARISSLLSEWNLPPLEAARWRVKALMILKRNDEAMEACREWLRLKPDHPEALWQLADLEIAREGMETVRARFARLARIPSRPPVYAEIYASLCRRAGETQAAAEQYTRLATAAPTPRIQRKQAFILAKTGREADAIPMMEEFLRADPRDFYMHAAYEAASRRSHQIERAQKFYQELLALHPDEKSLHGRLRRVSKPALPSN